MATPREYFEKDASKNLRINAIHTITDKNSGEVIEISASIALDFESGAKYALLYIPESHMAAQAIYHYLFNIQDILKISESVLCSTGFHGTDEQISSDDLQFSGRVTVYTASVINEHDRKILYENARNNGLNLVIRDGAYLEERSKKDVPRAFICHDTRDKEPFVRELASKLQSMLLSVWYDEYSLKVGDSLRGSIEKGLKECHKCVLVLSPNFVTNEGWTKAEFDSIFTREILQKQQIILPIWHEISKEQVFDYSPRLLDKVGISSSLGVEEVARRVAHALS